ncbi:MAG: hypothetical protein QM731_17455 [Chitinophagaceae bacterium]
MRKLFFIFIVLLGISTGVVAQDGNKLEALKIAYITKKLDLSTEEAQKFWPIYNQYMAEIRKVRSEARQNNEKEIDIEDKILTIRKKYNTEFGKALSPEKVNAFFKAEKDFGTTIQKELQERRQERQENRRRGLN